MELRKELIEMVSDKLWARMAQTILGLEETAQRKFTQNEMLKVKSSYLAGMFDIIEMVSHQLENITKNEDHILCYVQALDQGSTHLLERFSKECCTDVPRGGGDA